jgi:hypothetical protein
MTSKLEKKILTSESWGKAVAPIRLFPTRIDSLRSLYERTTREVCCYNYHKKIVVLSLEWRRYHLQCPSYLYFRFTAIIFENQNVGLQY